MDQLRAHVVKLEADLDAAIAAAGRTFVNEFLRRPYGRYDLFKATEESYALSKGGDLCYDRPATGVTYGLWYHARRVNTCLRQVLPSFAEVSSERLIIYDLGAGTGAFQWAFALAAVARRVMGFKTPSLHIVNIDSSPVQLQFLELLWNALVERIPDVATGVTYERAVNSWTSSQAYRGAEGWLCASYLFDHSDKAEDLSRDFDALLEVYEPARLLLSTSAKKGHAYFETLAQGMGKRGYVRVASAKVDCFTGYLKAVNRLRAELKSNGFRGIRPNASWEDPSYAGAVFARSQRGLGLEEAVWQGVDLFIPELPKRRHVILTKEQKKAARLSKNPTVLYGAAGSGKSIVLTERIRRLVEKEDYSHDLRILITTFNKELIKSVLKPWTSQLLDSDRFKLDHGRQGGATYEYYFKDLEGKQSEHPNLSIMHFDVLPTRLGSVHEREKGLGFRLAGEGEGTGAYEAEIACLIQEAIAHVRDGLSEQGIAPSRVEHVLDQRYVYDELHRIVYGQDAITEEEYLDVSRPGRPRLNRNSLPRQVLWQVIERFRNTCKEQRIRTFLHRRIHLLNLLKKGVLAPPFTHVFVDEMQDCTPADFAIFYGLVQDPNKLFLTGDLAQAVHMGRSATTWLPRSGPEQKRFVSRVLHGSFRLPFRVSEALIPLSERIRTKRKGCQDAIDTALQHPFKGSPPGIRPVIIAAKTPAAMAHKLLALAAAYGCEGLGAVGFNLGKGPIIMEYDPDLRNAIKKTGGVAWTDTILRLKGMEYPWVVWSTRAGIPADEDAEEYAYTIMTRGSNVLTIALFPDPDDATQAVLNTFQPGQVICWDLESEIAFRAARQDRQLYLDVEPHGDGLATEVLPV